jgi:uncharacterized integral membrane protein
LTEYKNYISAIEEVAPPPPMIEVQRNSPTVETNLGLVLTLANLMLTAIIVIFLIVDGTQAIIALIVGAIYFTITMVVFTLLVTGSLPIILADFSRERIEHHRIDAYQELGMKVLEWRLAVEQTRQIELMGRRPPADPVQTASNYVPAIADGERAKVEGVGFVMGLFDTQGRPDSTRLHRDGRLRIRMIGSKRGSGSREAGLWLLKQGIVKKVAGGYALDLKQFPHRESLRHLL